MAGQQFPNYDTELGTWMKRIGLLRGLLDTSEDVLVYTSRPFTETIKSFLTDFRDIPDHKGGVGDRKYFAKLVSGVDAVKQSLQKLCPRRHNRLLSWSKHALQHKHFAAEGS